MNVFTGDSAIADAIAEAGEQYTIKVYTGTYTTNVVVDVNKLYIAESYGENVTVVAANATDHVFHVTADNVLIKGLDICGATGTDKAGIYLDGNTGCLILENRCGWSASCNSTIGISLYQSSNNIIVGNHCDGNDYGIFLDNGGGSSNNTIYLNNFSNNTLANIHSAAPSTNTWASPTQMYYSYSAGYWNYLGNY